MPSPEQTTSAYCFTPAHPKEKATAEGKIFLKGDGKNQNGFSNYLVSIGQPATIPAVSALGYDAYLAMYKAIELAQSTDGDAIRQALTKLSYVGVTGEISFNSDGDANKNAAFIKEVENGKFVFKEITTIE